MDVAPRPQDRVGTGRDPLAALRGAHGRAERFGQIRRELLELPVAAFADGNGRVSRFDFGNGQPNASQAGGSRHHRYWARPGRHYPRWRQIANDGGNDSVMRVPFRSRKFTSVAEFRWLEVRNKKEAVSSASIAIRSDCQAV